MISPAKGTGMSRGLLRAAACAASLLLISSGVHAATIATDSAASAIYNDGWQSGDNGGTGWGGGWTFRNGGNAVQTNPGGAFFGVFVGSSLGNNSPANSDSNGDGDINSPVVNRAWGMYANTSNELYAVRPFAAPLQVGQTVKWDMDNGNVDSTRVVGLRFLSNANDINTRVFEARLVGGDSFYTTIGNPNQTSTIGFSRQGIHLEYTLTGPSTYSLKITRKENNVTQTMTGTNVNANMINGLAFRDLAAGSGAAFDAYFNNIAITTPNVPPTVIDGAILNVDANDPGTVMHTFTATDPDLDPLTWSNFQFGTYTPAYGGAGPGPLNAATFNPSDQKFNWNSIGSPRGIYTWNVTASDGQGGSDQGTLTVHVTAVPEPSALALCGLVMTGLVCFSRRAA